MDGHIKEIEHKISDSAPHNELVSYLMTFLYRFTNLESFCNDSLQKALFDKIIEGLEDDDIIQEL